MSGGGGDKRLGLGGTQLMEQRPLGTPEPAPPRAPGTQLIAQTPPPGPDPNAVPLYGAPPPPNPPASWPEAPPPPQQPQPQQPFDFANAVPAYGIPPQAFQNQPPPQAPPPQVPYPHAQPPQAQSPQAPYPQAQPPQAYNQYAQGVQNAYGSYTGATGLPSSGGNDAIMSRLKGGGILLLGLALLAFNAFLIFTQDYFYPKTLIIAFPVCWVGFFTVLAGKPVKPDTHTQPGWWLIGMFAGGFLALVAGIVAAIFITE